MSPPVKPRASTTKFLQSIQGKLLILLFVLVVPTLLIETYDTYNKYETRRAEELRGNLEVARAVAKAFEAFAQDVFHQQTAVGIALTQSATTTDLERNLILDKCQAANPVVWNLAWVNPKGFIVAASNRKTIGVNLSDRSHIQEVLAGKDRTVSELYLTKTTSEPGFTISSAVRSERGGLLGIVIAVIVPDQLDSVLKVERSEGAAVSLVDHQGRMVYRYPHRDVTWEDRNWLKIMPEIGKALGGEEVTWIGLPQHGSKNRIMAEVPVPSIGWAAGAGRTEEIALAEIKSVLVFQVASFLAVVLGSFLTALFDERQK